MQRRGALALACAALLAVGCDVHGVSDPGTLSNIVVTPNPQLLTVNGAQQFTATGTDFSGARVSFTPSWSVSAGGGTISAAGVFTAGGTPGTYSNTVTASSGGVSGSATVIVTAGPLVKITVTPTPVTLAISGTQQFVAVGQDAAGNVVQFTPTWSVVAGGGAVTGTGLFTAGTVVGTFTNTVQASSGGITGTATVNVTAGPLASITVTPNPSTLTPAATQQFTAVGRDASGNTVAISPTWSVTAGGGTINAAGMFTAGNTPGTYANTVRATSGAISGTATVTVTVGPLASITVTPNPATLAIGTAQQFTAVGKDAVGNAVTINPTWSVVAGGGTISASGNFTAGNTLGTFANTVQASSGGIRGNATVTVIAGPLSSITVTPNPVTVQSGDTQQFIAVGHDAGGNVFVITPVWAVVNGGGTINPATGLFTAGGVAGTFNNTVRATSGSVSGFATVTVTVAAPPPPLINLGTAAPNGIMAGTAFTCVIGGVINANIAISPGSTVTGFPPCIITGVQHLADAVAAQAQIDLTTAYNTLAALPCPPANLISANLGGTTKGAGVYCSATGIGVTGTLTLDGGGDPNATFVFQAGTSLTTAGNVVLINGAQAKNVYWQVGSSATIGTASQWQGNILALTSITLVDNATLIGRALARNGAVSLGTNNVITLP
ncbi:MAG TPA: ice-binding family protein [Gemmatimonadaceae bacterium]